MFLLLLLSFCLCRPSPGMVPFGTDTTTPGRSPQLHRQAGFTPQSHGPPIHSMLERNSTSQSPMYGRSPVPQQSPFFGGGVSTTSPYGAGGGAGRPTTALGVGWGSSSGQGNGRQSESFMAGGTVVGSSSSVSNGVAAAAGMRYEDLEAMWRVRVIHTTPHYHALSHSNHHHFCNTPSLPSPLVMVFCRYGLLSQDSLRQRQSATPQQPVQCRCCCNCKGTNTSFPPLNDTHIHTI